LAGERNGDRTLEVVQPLDLASDPLPWNGRPVPTVEAVDESRARDADITATVLAWTGVGASVAALGASLYWASIDDDCIATGSDPCDAVRTTKSEAIVATSAGVTLSAVTGYLWARQRPTQRRLLRGGRAGAAGGLSASRRRRVFRDLRRRPASPQPGLDRVPVGSAGTASRHDRAAGPASSGSC
jgi:hypothetical protein